MFKSKHKPRRNALRAGMAAGSVLVAGAALSAGCLDRPVVKQEPRTSNIYVDVIANERVDKIDLLFVIDNSVSMADKQQILRAAVPTLVERLVNPSCVHPETGETAPFPAGGGNCPQGFSREFEPIENIHIGVVTSSLGGFGGPANQCATPLDDLPHTNDEGQLVPNMRPEFNLPRHDPHGFLRWQGGGQSQEDFIGDFTSHVLGAGETGCGYEAVMEGWYRFLIDPEPFQDLTLNDERRSVPVNIPFQPVLEQRAAFLRPDSLVAIIMLSDENDCSVRAGSTNWLSSQIGPNNTLWLASETCDTDPNSRCCHSCQQGVPDNCPAAPRCEGAPRHHYDDDKPNIRCMQQKQRFGVEFLYPPSRYANALRNPEVPNWAGEMRPNPLFAPGPNGESRSSNLVFLAGIIGVPWQDIATEDSLTHPTELKYLTVPELTAAGRWAVILGDPRASPPVEPTDPLMRESVAPREGFNPITNDTLARWDTNPLGNPINGHEYDVNDFDDLQYACTFRLSSPITPEECAQKPPGVCDCAPGMDEEEDPQRAAMQKPLCFAPGASSPGNLQHSAKAYPGTRYLETLREFGENSIVASICPKNIDGDPDDPNVGYNPAVNAIVDRLGEALAGSCLPRPLDTDDDGNVPCSVIEVQNPGAMFPDCNRPGRSEVNPEVAEVVRRRLRNDNRCDGSSPISCNQFTMCAVDPLQDGDRDICLFQDGLSSYPPGYCYIDPGTGLRNAGAQHGENCSEEEPEGCRNPIVESANCPPTRRRLLRFVGGAPNTPEETPAPRSTTFVACVGRAL